MPTTEIFDVLNITSAGYYKYSKSKNNPNLSKALLEQKIVDLVIIIFRGSKSNYGKRKIKIILQNKYKLKVSHRKIALIMHENALISNYTRKNFKPQNDQLIKEDCPNYLNRQFNGKAPKEWLVSDLTYVLVNGKWCYICTVVDLFNREVVAYSVGENKTTNLILDAFSTIKYDLRKTKYLHTDCGSEFKGSKLVAFLEGFDITRSLSAPGRPIDNAVAEAFYKVLKTEFVLSGKFKSIEDLKTQTVEYLNWYNTERIHGFCGGVSPQQYASENHRQEEKPALSITS